MAGRIRGLIPVLLAAVLAVAVPLPAAADGEMAVVDRDTVWEGRMVFDRTVVVRKGATLTLRPGTRVEFLRKDGDGDDIGDAALRVEGRLVAVGTREEPIVFTSGEEEPRPADWRFVIIEFSRDSILTHCRISYAYSGLQVHYSTVRVAHCVFSNNVDGFRFSTANVVVENCLMEGNVNGVRYEERRSRTTIRKNVIRGNQVGVFCVVESEGSTELTENNIYGNSRYNFKMGFLQKGDVEVPGNWWGTDDPGAVGESIFDGRDEPGLGKVGYEPFSPVEISPAGPDID